MTAGRKSGTQTAEQLGELAVRGAVHPGPAVGEANRDDVDLVFPYGRDVHDVDGAHVRLALDPARVLLGAERARRKIGAPGARLILDPATAVARA